MQCVDCKSVMRWINVHNVPSNAPDETGSETNTLICDKCDMVAIRHVSKNKGTTFVRSDGSIVKIPSKYSIDITVDKPIILYYGKTIDSAVRQAKDRGHSEIDVESELIKNILLDARVQADEPSDPFNIRTLNRWFNKQRGPARTRPLIIAALCRSVSTPHDTLRLPTACDYVADTIWAEPIEGKWVRMKSRR